MRESLRERARAEPRPYDGASSEERRARRRAQLLEAGLELFGTRGYAPSSVREVCLAASLNRRYFYEAFSTREDLMRAVYDELADELAKTIFTAVDEVEGIEEKIRAGMSAFWAMMTADQRRARILTLEIIASARSSGTTAARPATGSPRSSPSRRRR